MIEFDLMYHFKRLCKKIYPFDFVVDDPKQFSRSFEQFQKMYLCLSQKNGFDRLFGRFFTNKELDEFCAKYLTKEFIDSKIAPLISDESQEYFYRAEFMRKVISDKYPELGASFLEDYIDTKYGEIFES